MKQETIESIYLNNLVIESENLGITGTSLGESWHESSWQDADNIPLEEYIETLRIHARHRKELVKQIVEDKHYG